MIVQKGKITGIEFYKTEKLDTGEWIEDKEQIIKLRANFIISAFGSGLIDPSGNVFINPKKLVFVTFINNLTANNKH